jgi:hypothetical protein
VGDEEDEGGEGGGGGWRRLLSLHDTDRVLQGTPLCSFFLCGRGIGAGYFISPTLMERCKVCLAWCAVK